MSQEQREKEDSARVVRQRPVLRVCSELALVGIIKDAPDRSGAEWIMKAVKDLVGLCFNPRYICSLKAELQSFQMIQAYRLYHC